VNGTTIRRRAVTIAGHRTSVSIEDAFWAILKTIAAERGRSLGSLIADLDETRTGNLSSAVRVHVLEYLLGKVQDGDLQNGARLNVASEGP
jgi:predicted DNA-binding ribbon-helix-helix protein